MSATLRKTNEGIRTKDENMRGKYSEKFMQNKKMILFPWNTNFKNFNKVVWKRKILTHSSKARNAKKSINGFDDAFKFTNSTPYVFFQLLVDLVYRRPESFASYSYAVTTILSSIEIHFHLLFMYNLTLCGILVLLCCFI